MHCILLKKYITPDLTLYFWELYLKDIKRYPFKKFSLCVSPSVRAPTSDYCIFLIETGTWISKNIILLMAETTK